MTDSLHVLVVDDSAVMRLVMSTILGEEQGMRVTVASDPMIALQKMKVSRPDVVLLDLEMPRMDGLTFLSSIMRDDPLPVVVCSGAAGRGSENALLALQAGAVDIVAKPRVGLREFLLESKELLIDALRGAAAARLPIRQPVEGRSPTMLRAVSPSRSVDAGPARILAVAASTGGTEALRVFVGALPSRCPPTLVVQHMPAGFTRAFAGHLDAISEAEVREACDGDLVCEGRVLIAPGDRHMELVNDGAQLRVRIGSGPLVSHHRPSADVLFRSVARVGSGAVGVIMTGMGDDGAEGLLAMRRAGAMTLAQDEASCVVFGMPREAVRRGAVMEVLPLSALAERALRSSG